MTAHEKLYLSRHGSFLEPQEIHVRVSVGEATPPTLDATMPLDGFLDTVVAGTAFDDVIAHWIDRMPHPATVWTHAQLVDAMVKAAATLRPHLAAALRTSADAAVVAFKHEIGRVM